ncbi:hypothetical protein [Kitasatospora brasiliensis]|uniref:hypothetical protein n=1 Tax=Kitasatospora brasiliensis TaxID=3058040 RepID=UPI003D76E9D6
MASSAAIADALVKVRACTWRRSAALIGFAGAVGAVGAFGGVLVNLAFRQSFLAGGNGDTAYAGFLLTYAGCSALTWAVWRRRGFARRGLAR